MAAIIILDRTAELEALRDEIFANHTRQDITLRDCAEEALATLGELLGYAVEWDMHADECLLARHWPAFDSAEEVTPEPEPEPPTTPAGRKAAYHLARGAEIHRCPSGWLVPSGSRSAVIHHVGDNGECSCEAGLHGRACWHVAAVDLVRKAAA